MQVIPGLIPSKALCPAWQGAGLLARPYIAVCPVTCIRTHMSRIANTAMPCVEQGGGSRPSTSCPGVDLYCRPYDQAHRNPNDERTNASIANRLITLKGKYRKGAQLTRSVKAEVRNYAGDMTFIAGLKRWAALERTILRGVAAGKTWREAIQPLALPEAHLPAGSGRQIETHLISKVGLKTFGQCSQFVPETLARLGIEHCRDELEARIVARLGLEALRQRASVPALVERWGLSTNGSHTLARLAATTYGVERVMAGEPVPAVAESLGLHSVFADMLERTALTRAGVEEVLRADSKDRRSDGLARLGFCREHQDYLRHVIAPRFAPPRNSPN